MLSLVSHRLQVTGVQAAGGNLTSALVLNFYPCDSGATVCTNNNGNLWRETIQSPGISGTVTEEYRYDALNRLKVAVENPVVNPPVTASSTCTTALGGSWCQEFGYDSYGNRWVDTYSVNGQSTVPPANTPRVAAHFDAANHLTVNGAAPDASGNLQQIGAVQYTYDGENRLTQVASGSTVIATYGYDGEGRRVQSASGTTTTYVYDAAGQLAADYVTAGTAPAAPCGTCYLTVDHLGSTRLLTDGSGNAVACHDYEPFGEEIASGAAGRSACYGQLDNPRQKFTGKERDSELANSGDPYGLDYFGARYFSAAQGRFTSVDPAFESALLELPQTWNRYSYVYNRSTFATDPDGRCPICVGAIVGGVVEGGWNLGSQFIEHGYSFKGTDWGQVGANFVGGAVTGGVAIATGGTSLLSNAAAGDLLAGTVSTVAGGIVTRTAEGQNADEVFSPSDIATDAVAGFVGGAGGHVAADFIHVPEDPALPGSRRHAVGRRKLAKYDAAVGARNSALRVQAGIGVAAASPPSHAVTGFVNNFWNILDWLVSPPPPQPVITTKICYPDENGRQVCQ